MISASGREPVLIEIVKIIVSIFFGGFAGAVLNDWFRRRDSKLQTIPLIERVNRLVNPELDGITLARVVGEGGHRQLEELPNLREYQLTLRNTSTIHLQDVEILFEFPAKDVQALVTRPALSKTPLVGVLVAQEDNSEKAFRWKIPHFPSGDSVEFTFRAVDPSSPSFEVALFNNNRTVIEKVTSEPAASGRGSPQLKPMIAGLVVAFAIPLLLYSLRLLPSSQEKLTTVKLSGCDLQIISFYDRYGQDFDSPWRVKHRVFNLGAAPCMITSDQLDKAGPFAVLPGVVFERELITKSRPVLIESPASVGQRGADPSKTVINLYVEP